MTLKRLNRHGWLVVSRPEKHQRTDTERCRVIVMTFEGILKQPLRHWYLMGYVTFILLVLLHNMIGDSTR
jgi:hypothetical protein